MQRERGDELESELDLHADADVRSWTTRAPRTGSRQSPLVGLPPGASLIGAVDRPGVRRRYPVRIVRFERAVLEVDVPRVLEVWPAAVSRPAPDLAACERKGAYLDLASALMTAARRQLASGLPLRVYACRAGLHLHLTHEVITAWGALDHVAAVTAHDLPVWLQTRLRASGLTVSEITSHLDLARFRVRSEGESARVEVAQDGTVTISGKGLKTQTAQANANGVVKLKVITKGKFKRKLRKLGKVKLKASFTYNPTGAAPATQKKTEKLLKKRRRRHHR